MARLSAWPMFPAYYINMNPYSIILGIILVLLGTIFFIQTGISSKNPITLKWKKLRKNSNKLFWLLVLMYIVIGLLFILFGILKN